MKSRTRIRRPLVWSQGSCGSGDGSREKKVHSQHVKAVRERQLADDLEKAAFLKRGKKHL